MSESHPRQGAASVTDGSDSDKTTECRYCERDFETYSARRKHEGLSHTAPYQDKEILEEYYHQKGLSIAKVADKLDTNHTRIEYWLNKHGIDTRDPNDHQERNTAKFGVDSRGYEKWSTYVGDNNKHVQVHRLLAVSEFGFDAVSNMVVHHKNEHKWDNRPCNIELMTAAEHAKHHHG